MLYFKADSDQRDVLEMTDTMKELIFDRQIRLSSKLLERIVMQYTESQSWSKLLGLINSCEYRNCDPNQKTVSYLKSNLVYCFDTNMRSQLKDSFEAFDAKFFSNQGRQKYRDYVKMQSGGKTSQVEEAIATPEIDANKAQ